MTRSRRRIAPLAVLAAAGALVLASCAETSDGDLETLKDNGSVKVAFAGEEPYSFPPEELQKWEYPKEIKFPAK